MNDPDEALKLFNEIVAEFDTFCKSRGGASETDTRVKVTDRILKEVLDWPELDILDIVHVAGYVEKAAKVLCHGKAAQETFIRERPSMRI